jgi:hypothetical protein
LNCLEFETVLDEGQAERLPAEALAHARGCASCARSLALARSLERALEAHFSTDVPPPAGFAERVMARVERGEARGVRWLAMPDPLPWWTRAAAEPRVVLALAAVALFVWRGDRWQAGALAAWDALARAPQWATEGLLAAGFGPLADALDRAFASVTAAPWSIQLGMTLGVAPLLAFGAWLAWRAGERLVDAVGTS